MQLTVDAIAPYVISGHGFVLCLEDETGPRCAPSGAALILARGLPHGDDMRAQVDYVFERAAKHAKHVCVLVETAYPSFRFPDASLRALFAYSRKYEQRIEAVYFVGLSPLLRKGLRLFGLPLLPSFLRTRIRMVTDDDPDVVPLRKDVDPCATIAWLRRIEGLTATPLDARHFDTNLLRTSRKELRAASRRCGQDDG